MICIKKAVPKTDGVFTEIYGMETDKYETKGKREEIYTFRNMFKPSIEWGGGNIPHGV